QQGHREREQLGLQERGQQQAGKQCQRQRHQREDQTLEAAVAELQGAALVFDQLAVDQAALGQLGNAQNHQQDQQLPQQVWMVPVLDQLCSQTAQCNFEHVYFPSMWFSSNGRASR